MDEDQMERHVLPGRVLSECDVSQTDLCMAYIEVMRKMCDISENVDPRTVAFIFGRPVPDTSGVVSTRPIMVSASLLSIDSFAPAVIQERRKNLAVKRDVKRRFHPWNSETKGTAFP